ncbi:unnamed protein product, partial [Rotaria sordida]
MTTTSAHSTAHDDGNANELPMSVVNSNETYDKEHLFRNLSEEKAKFMWFQLLIEIIFRLNCNEYDCRQMLDECRAKYIGNAAELKKMDEFQSSFKPEDAIKWYTRDSFLYQVNINLTILGKFFRLMGDFNRALRYYDMLIKQLSSDNEQLPLIYNNLGTAWCAKGDWQQALKCYNQAKNLLESIPTVPNKEHTLTLIYQGFTGIYQIIHQWELGVRYGLKCLNLQSQCLPEKHPEIADTCLTLGWCYARLGEYKNASEMYHRALDIQMSTLPQYHPQIAATLNNLAGLYKDTGDYEIALEYYRKAYEIYSLISPDGYGVATIYNNLGRLYAKMKHYPLSINYYEKCIELRERLE